ncbi:high-affinity nickel-transport family protein [Actinidia rufa]|uniref:High-affinity nickel-transport family protein n=1 Tax=Actinidia rufa TaxID=165716 RepID=A0A7J0DJI5_9ERIC|nr:high-affinity nickel-transport family protein [Actinidia rufa]
MERLIYSSTVPSKIHLKPGTHHLTRLGRIDSTKLGFQPPRRTECRRLNSLFRKHEDSPSSCSTPSTIPSKFPNNFSIKSSSISRSSLLDSPDGSNSKPHFLKQIMERCSEPPKAIAAGTVALLSALILILIHPVIVSPALAAFQTAAKTGAPAAAVAGERLVRTELLSSAWTGFLAGCLHTLSGPDHLAALAPLSIGRTRMESAAVGALWGCGHDAGQVIFGLLFLLLKDRLHIEIIRTWGTRVVGFTLLVIGAMGIREASEVPTPCVAVENVECDVSVYEALENPTIGKKKKKIGFATFATGIVHGLQPDALMMVLPALALPSRLAGAAFLGMFLVGTVIAMGSYTVFIGSCSEALKERVPRITEKLTWASSLIAITLGLALIISQFFGFSLY